MDKVPTVSDTKRHFYTHHTRPINSVYRRFVEELMVEMHLLSVNVDFRYDPLYALGVITSFKQFMQGYRPETDKDSILAALCQSISGNPQQYRQDAQEMLSLAKGMSISELEAGIDQPREGDNALLKLLRGIRENPRFKYSRLFAIGLYTVLVQADPQLSKDTEKSNQALGRLSETLHLPSEKLQKDLELYRSNLDKIEQLLGVLEEALEAERKKREKWESAGKGTETGS